MARLSSHGLTRRPWFVERDLVVEAGEIVVVSGATGSGKTLFLRGLADLDPVDAGDVRLDGVSRATMTSSAWRSEVHLVQQRGVVLPGTVGTMVDRLCAIGPATTDRAAYRLPTGMDRAADPERLSGGERQMLALSLALWRAPAVLLLDESTSALDPAAAATWESAVRDYAAAGGAVLWVAHDASLAGRLEARVEVFP